MAASPIHKGEFYFANSIVERGKRVRNKNIMKGGFIALETIIASGTQVD